jgi:hypothetical protein
MLPDTRAWELFMLLHGMLFTNIQLDDFQSTLACLMEWLQIEDVEECNWIMMAVINVSSVLEYGKPMGVLMGHGIIKLVSAQSGLHVMVKHHAIDEKKTCADNQLG